MIAACWSPNLANSDTARARNGNSPTNRKLKRSVWSNKIKEATKWLRVDRQCLQGQMLLVHGMIIQSQIIIQRVFCFLSYGNPSCLIEQTYTNQFADVVATPSRFLNQPKPKKDCCNICTCQTKTVSWRQNTLLWPVFQIDDCVMASSRECLSPWNVPDKIS